MSTVNGPSTTRSTSVGGCSSLGTRAHRSPHWRRAPSRSRHPAQADLRQTAQTAHDAPISAPPAPAHPGAATQCAPARTAAQYTAAQPAAPPANTTATIQRGAPTTAVRGVPGPGSSTPHVVRHTRPRPATSTNAATAFAHGPHAATQAGHPPGGATTRLRATTPAPRPASAHTRTGHSPMGRTSVRSADRRTCRASARLWDLVTGTARRATPVPVLPVSTGAGWTTPATVSPTTRTGRPGRRNHRAAAEPATATSTTRTNGARSGAAC